MFDFWAVALSPMAVNKFLHTVTSSWVLGAVFVVGVSSWFLLRNRHREFAVQSIRVAAIFGLVASGLAVLTGDGSAYNVAQFQPMKLAAMEGLYKGEVNAGIVAAGVLNPSKTAGDDKEPFLFEIKAPYALGLMATRGLDNFTPGIDDLVFGNEKFGIEGADKKIEKGKIALQALKDYKLAKDANDTAAMQQAREILFGDQNMQNLGYGYLDDAKQIVPPVALTFYSFHVMVALGSYFILLFFVTLFLAMRKNLAEYKKILWLCVFSIPLGYVACEAGWIVAEVGRQPWAIQDLMPVGVAATSLAGTNIMISFALFAVLFTVLFIAEIKIMLKQIKIGF